jgi:hypothetical protein
LPLQVHPVLPRPSRGDPDCAHRKIERAKNNRPPGLLDAAYTNWAYPTGRLALGRTFSHSLDPERTAALGRRVSAFGRSASLHLRLGLRQGQNERPDFGGAAVSSAVSHAARGSRRARRRPPAGNPDEAGSKNRYHTGTSREQHAESQLASSRVRLSRWVSVVVSCARPNRRPRRRAIARRFGERRGLRRIHSR